MKHSININSTILFYIFQVKTYKRMPYQDVFYAFMMNINNNVGISTTATTTTSSTTTTTNGLYKSPLAIGCKPQGANSSATATSTTTKSTTIKTENNQLPEVVVVKVKAITATTT